MRVICLLQTQALFDHVPESLNPNVTGWLVYNPTGPLPNINNLTQFAPYDDYTLVPYDHEPLLDKVDLSFTLNLQMEDLGNGAN